MLSAIAEGNHARGGIAGYLGRKSTDLGHALTVLEDVGMTTLPDPANKTKHELDVVVFGRAADGRESILAIGEAKSGDIVGRGHLHRLECLRDLLAARDERAAGPVRLLLFSGCGFGPELLEEIRDRDDAELVGLDRLYQGS